MKSKQWQEIKNLTQNELVARLEEYQVKLFNLKLSRKTKTLKNPLEIRTLRRDIARIKTLLRQYGKKD